MHAMTFPRQQPAGWADGDAITASEITNIDANLSNAVDGEAGGVFMPSAALQVGGSGLQITNCVGHGVTGDYSLSNAQASLSVRVDRTTIDPSAASSVIIDVSSDIYFAASSATSNFDCGLNIYTVGKQPPYDGNIILVRKFPNVADNSRIRFLQDDSTTDSLGFLPGVSAAVSNAPQSNNFIWAEFVYSADIKRWQVLNCHSQYVFP